MERNKEKKKRKNYAKKPRNNVLFADKRETGDVTRLNEKKKKNIYTTRGRWSEQWRERSVKQRSSDNVPGPLA